MIEGSSLIVPGEVEEVFYGLGGSKGNGLSNSKEITLFNFLPFVRFLMRSRATSVSPT